MAVRHMLLRLLAITISSVIVLLAAPGLAEAHTEFDFSVPADGASVSTPVDEITVAFTSAVTLVGNGFAVLDPQNNELAPPVVTDDDTVFRLQFDPPLAGGTVGVRYEVRAEDGHVLDGSFVFEVDAPALTTSTPAATTTIPTTTAAPTTAAPAAPATAAPTTPAEVTDTRAPDSTPPEQTDAVIDADDGEETDDGSATGSVLAVGAVVALVGGGFLIHRSRTST
jgi:methionine-rich copper-binding protein CopC